MSVLIAVLCIAMAFAIYVYMSGIPTGGSYQDTPWWAHVLPLPFAGAFLWLAGAVLGIW